MATADSVGIPQGLKKLRISPRYSAAERTVENFHGSTTYRGKADAGLYESTSGQYSQAQFIRDMSRSGVEDRGDPHTTCELVVFHSSSNASPNGKEQFRVVLDGPAQKIDNFVATAKMFATTAFGKARANLFPVFVPSCGRPEKAHLNYEADHVFGCLGAYGQALQPVICVVVEPRDKEAYRHLWPQALLMTLPHNGQGAGFTRWAIQKVCTLSYYQDGQQWVRTRFPFVWVCDDSLTSFYRLDPLSTRKETFFDKAKKERQTLRVPVTFREAFLDVQKHPFLERAAISGFLRDDGTAVCKSSSYKSDELSIYKVVLLNLWKLKSLGIQYEYGLRRFEDICINADIQDAPEGRTLKCQTYCYRALLFGSGGCAKERKRKLSSGQMTLDDMIAPQIFSRLSTKRQQAIRRLHKWAVGKENQYQGFE